MNAYFGIVAQLTAMFCWITLFSIPLMYIYSSYNGLATAVYYPLDMWSLGNMGKCSNAIKQFLSHLFIRRLVRTVWLCPTDC